MASDAISRADSGSSSGLSLAERLREGSPTAWRDLVELYGPLLDRWCRAANVPPDAVADIAQEVFMAAFRGLDGFDGRRADATFRGWLWTIARSRVIDFHRRRKGKCAATGGSTAHANLQSIIDPVPIDDPTEPDHASALLHRALEQIRSEFTDKTWDLFWRATVLGHPTDAIGDEYGVTSAAVRQAKSRVLRRLRKQLGEL
ncbi:MAG: sigma-70 family RNA polymerase sigma factor [Planctomycetes bacterium]|nr:sigma-70 family RNA polymerase sigma factor [Planctomycetota bacterium]